MSFPCPTKGQTETIRKKKVVKNFCKFVYTFNYMLILTYIHWWTSNSNMSSESKY